ncbi:hypothetical protein QVN85_12225 [Oscillibacter valericigenes]|nr:hypothetical protein [Oscillibacter valericigenes]
MTKLDQLGFNISQSGHNDAFMTAVVTANLMQLDYVIPDDKHDDAIFTYAARSNNVLFPLLCNHGYSILGVGEASFYGLEDASASSAAVETVTMGGENLTDLILKKTAIISLINRAMQSRKLSKTRFPI